MEAARTLKANLKLEGKPCGWCQAPLALGDDAAVCAACDKEHHQGCWDSKAGCATEGCRSAPLRRLDLVPERGPSDSPFPAEIAPGMIRCPQCGLSVTSGTELCPGCRAITSPDGIYHGPRTPAPGAAKSLVLGLIGLFLCGVILGPLAISSANRAKEAIARDPSLDGDGLATAGKILGVIDLILFAVTLIYRISMSNR